MAPGAKSGFKFGKTIVSSHAGCVSSRKFKPLSDQRSESQGWEVRLLQMRQVSSYNYKRHHLYFHLSVPRLLNLGNGRNSAVYWLLVHSMYYILAASAVDSPIGACHRLHMAYCFTPNMLSTIGLTGC